VYVAPQFGPRTERDLVFHTGHYTPGAS
jgi:hypothetical protein